MATPSCAATYEAGHSGCDGDRKGGACRLRKPCIVLAKFAKAEKFEPARLASSLSLKEIKAFYSGRLELRIVGASSGRRLHKSIQQKRKKLPPVFGKTHWKLYHEFEKALVEIFQFRRVVNRLTQLRTNRKRAVLRTGVLYPVTKTNGGKIERVTWFCANTGRADICLVKIEPLNRPARLWIWMKFPIAELELRAAPELISELGLKTRRRVGCSPIFVKIHTASARLIRLSVYALRIMVDSGYLGVSEFGLENLSAEGG